MNRKQPQAGIILLVVLSSLTFFSVLIAAYLVFSNQSRESSFAISARNIHRPNVNGIIDDALMTLIRGTDDGTNAFWGEDLLSDYYGRGDGELSLTVTTSASINDSGGNPTGFVKVAISGATITPPNLNDVYAGRVITFSNGTLVNRSYRVIRSLFVGGSHQIIFQLESRYAATDISNTDTLVMNGIPRNAAGIGFDGTDINATVIAGSVNNTLNIPAGVGISTLPMAIQPNHLPGTVDKKSGTRGDFDEGYDAADFNNWFLSHRHSDGVVIPSFHRPSVLNYILNNEADWPSVTGAAGDVIYRDLMASFARATFRPLPLAASQFSTTSGALNPQFTGGNSSFALRIPLLMQSGGQARLDQFARALIGNGTPTGQSYDVDNDSDGIKDSIWIDLRLPLITAPDGKLLRPLIAPMIEDLSGRLNVNAHSNSQLTGVTNAGLDSDLAAWAGTNAALMKKTFRGLGYGPSEIALPPAVSASLVTQRLGTDGVPGSAQADSLDVLRTAWRPGSQAANGGYGYSIDPFGRGGVAIGRSGGLVAANSGTVVTASAQDEALNDPYESDPTGRLAHDLMLTQGELEAILRSNQFDVNLLPQRLRGLVSSVVGIDKVITTISKSDDTPPQFGFVTSGSAVEKLRTLYFPSLSNAQLVELIAPEIRLGRKLDINRSFGNGIDDDGDGVIDEPGEIPTTGAVPSVTNRIDDNLDGTVDEAGEVGEPAFAIPAASTATLPNGYANQEAFYVLDSTTAENGRTLLARQIYVLMMALSKDYVFPVSGAGINETDYHARRLAQWAVNVVDCRDPDSIMTRFVYDKNPFNGWDVPAVPSNENTVWGVEMPELLLTETLAFHDIAVQDTPTGGNKGIGSAPNNDKHTDQIGLPEGSLFVELYCPGSNVTDSTTRSYPQELYTNQSLDLARVTGNAPVWRLAISEPHFDKNISVDGDPTLNPVFQPLASIVDPVPALPSNKRPSRRRHNSALGDAYSYEKEESELANTAVASQLQFERYVLFTGAESNIAGMTSDNTFYLGGAGADNGSKSVTRGQYLCVLPRATTTFGYQSDKTTRSNQTIAFNGTNGVQHLPAGVAPGAPLFNLLTEYSRPKVFVATTTGGIPLNVSAPLAGYDTTANPLPADVPYDVANRLIPNVASTTEEEPFLGTVPEHSSIFLQRLADPTRDWNAVTNPYRVVDYMSLDLNVFSGQERPSKVTRTDPSDLATETYQVKYRRRSRQKNGSTRDSLGNVVKNQNALYSYLSEFDIIDDDVFDNYVTNIDTSADYFSFAPTNGHFYSSLGFLNTTQAAVNPAFASGFSEPFKTAFPNTNNDRNLPQVGFAIHPWLNRPFATPFESILVPACSQGRLFEEFTTVQGGADPVVFPTDATDLTQFHGPFRHLLNFFHSDRNVTEAAGFVSLFDYVHTLPPFRGEVNAIAPSLVAAPSDLNPLLAPPFNFRYGNIRNGCVNLNTLSEFPVWQGLMQGHMNATEYASPASSGVATQLAFDEFSFAKRGYDPIPETRVTSAGPYNYDATHLNPLFPTQFAGMFRDAATTRFSPSVRDTVTTDKLRRRPINGTLLRGNGSLDTNDPDRGGVANVGPQFVRGAMKAPTWDNSVTPAVDPHLDRNRNPFMRYQTLMRMPNLVSDNSQVFLIRLTLGFFEVDASNINSLGAEYGESTGEAQRYQAMFIIDRSIPVGFVPGVDMNARDTVIFERYYQ